MTREEIDIMWNKALQQSIKNGEQFTRYHFAELVRADERERFALECIDLVAFHGGPVDLEAAIRARGQA